MHDNETIIRIERQIESSIGDYYSNGGILPRISGCLPANERGEIVRVLFVFVFRKNRGAARDPQARFGRKTMSLEHRRASLTVSSHLVNILGNGEDTLFVAD